MEGKLFTSKMRTIPVFFLLFLSGIRTEELTTPSSFLPPRHFNHHSYELEKYLKGLKTPEPTKQGPVLFPNDAPPSPRLPLVVTSRPLAESIAKSDLTPVLNNSVAESSQINHVTYTPDYLRFQYQPVRPIAIPDYEAIIPDRIPYEDIVSKVRGNGVVDNTYNDYEERTSLPPLYKALSDYAQNKVLKTKQKPIYYDYKNNDPDYGKNYENNELPHGNENSEYNKGENYAFAYSVKDKNTGDDFSHRQQSSGSATNGEYRVRLPDGRMQIVSYTADENGYKADVRYDTDVSTNNHVDSPRNDYKENDYKENDYKENDYKYEVNHEVKDYNNDFRSNHNPNYKYNIQLNNDYTQRDFNIKPVKEDYYNQYTDTSKEYYNDYSLEYPSKYDTHNSKFAAFKPTQTTKFTTVRPSYEEIKDLFTRKPFVASSNYINDRAVEINAPSTPNYDGTTEKVVVIAPKLYTHVRSSTLFADIVNTTPKPFAVTPASYLASTIASIKERIRASKPILSPSFINRINKYLTFT